MFLLISYYFSIGACLGSFITCMAERVSYRQPIFKSAARSQCPYCKQNLRVWQLLPLIGVLIQRGRCWDCQHRISLRSTLVELLCGTLLAVTLPTVSLSLVPLLLGYGVLLFNSLTDYLTFSVYPLTLVLPASIGLWLQPPQLNGPFYLLLGLLLSLYLLAKFTHKFGLGDVDILIMLTLLATPAVVLTSLTMAAFGALLILLLDRQRTHLPFVPFLTWGFILCTQLV